jgi:proline iminopeptidase
MTPDDYTILESFLDVGDGHELYIHSWGNPKAKTPILFLHGGPGGGCHDGHKTYFDPKRHHVVFFDQRGSGRSLPHGSLEHNTTAHLVEDIEKVIAHLGLKKVVLLGGSWGSTLALLFALSYPKKVEALVIRGIFTGAHNETDYFDKGAFKSFFPDIWEWYLARTPKPHHANPTRYHFKTILEGDPSSSKASAYAYQTMEGALLKLDSRFLPGDFETFDATDAKLEAHYLSNYSFLPDNYILDNAPELAMPVWIVQGRYDFVCPPAAAYALHKKLPQSHLIWTLAGHHGSDRNSFDTVRALLTQFAD